MTIYSYGPVFPQSGWPVHNDTVGGIRLHEGNMKSEHWGYPEWTNFSIVDSLNETLDANFILGGDDPFNVTINKGLGVSATITHGLTAPPYNLNTSNVTATFTATGGIIFLNPTKTIFIGDMSPGQTVETPKWFPIGFGSIVITVEVTSDDGLAGVTETPGFLLLILTL